MSTVKKDDRVEAALKANYKTKKYGVTTSVGSTGLVRGQPARTLICVLGQLWAALQALAGCCNLPDLHDASSFRLLC